MSLLLLALALVSPASADAPYWEQLDDPGLVQAIDIGVSKNGDVAAAWERVAASKAMARQARAPLLPQASVTYSNTVQPNNPGFQFGLSGGLGAPDPDAPDTTRSGSYGLSASWDVDMGRSYTALRASTLDARAAGSDQDAAAMALANRIAGVWYDLVAVEQRLVIVRKQIEHQERMLEVIEMRFERGEATGLDVLQQRQQVAATRTLLPTLSSSHRVLEQQLAVLLGQDIGAELPMRPSELPDVPSLDATLPDDLLAGRPDLAAAEERLAAARARKYSATLSSLPTFRLNGFTGTQFTDFGEYATRKYWSVGTTASLPLFAGGRVYEGVRAARANELAAKHTLDQAKRNADAEVQGAIARAEEQRNYVAAVQAQRDAATLAHEAARQRYKSGSAAYINLLSASNAELQAELSAVAAQRDLLGIHLDLADARGGAWTHQLGERAAR